MRKGICLIFIYYYPFHSLLFKHTQILVKPTICPGNVPIQTRIQLFFQISLQPSQRFNPYQRPRPIPSAAATNGIDRPQQVSIAPCLNKKKGYTLIIPWKRGNIQFHLCWLHLNQTLFSNGILPFNERFLSTKTIIQLNRVADSIYLIIYLFTNLLVVTTTFSPLRKTQTDSHHLQWSHHRYCTTSK